jgi:DNA-directed RNA polymerase specialized sigma24 family protein
VITDECARWPVGAGDEADEAEVRRRMAQAVHACCRELTRSPLWRPKIADGRDSAPQESANQATDLDSLAVLSGPERTALALVVCGGLGYAQASRELGISPRETAILLRDALRRLTQVPSAST